MAALANPIVPGFHPDPSVCRVGADFYLACSSFEYFPGVPILHSTDLRHWTQIGNALDRPSQLRLDAAPSSGGIYAPTLRNHAGRYWLATTNVSDRGHLIVTATDPAGPWSDPVWVALPGFDPDLCWDAAGTCWFTYATFGERAGIWQAPIDPDTAAVLAQPEQLWSGTGLAAPEAPHLYEVDGRWYLLIAEGGTERGHAVSVARGPSPQGPFQGYPGNPVLSHRSTASPIQNTGHGDLVRDAAGGWWLVLLGVRPGGGSPGYHVLGRETFLTSVRWVDGWPLPEPVTLGAPSLGASSLGASSLGASSLGASSQVRERDEFDRPTLDPGWVAVREWPDLTCGDGRLTLRGRTFLGKRQRHHACQVRARVDGSAGTGGLAVRLDEPHHCEIEVADGLIRCWARIGPLAQCLAEVPAPDGPLVLCLSIEPEQADLGTLCAGPDRIRLGYERDGQVEYLAELDGRYTATEVGGGFTGRVLGMYARAGTVTFDWHEYVGG